MSDGSDNNEKYLIEDLALEQETPMNAFSSGQDASMQAANMFAMSILRKDTIHFNTKENGNKGDKGHETRSKNKHEFEEKDFHLQKQEDVQALIDIIKKPKKEGEELLSLANFFNDIPFISKTAQKLAPPVFISLIQRISYEFVGEQKTVFRKNDFGDKYYIILQGKVAVLADKAGINPDTPFHFKKESEPQEFAHKNLNNNEGVTVPAEKRIQFKEHHRISIVTTSPFLGRKSLHRQRSMKKDTSKNHFEISLKDESPKSSSAKLDFSNSFTPKSRQGATPSNKFSDPGMRISPSGGKKVSLFGRNHIPNFTGNKKIGFTTVAHESPQQSPDRASNSTPLLVSQLSFKQHVDSFAEKEEHDVSQTSEDKFEDFLEIHFPHEQVSRYLEAGAGFGELALIGNMRRTATVVTMKDTHFAVLDKTTYDEILREFHEGVYKQNLTFLQSISIFQDWSEMKLSAMLMVFDIQNYIRNNVVYSAGDLSKNIYLVKNGEVELIDSITIERKAKGKQKDLSNEADLDELSIKRKKAKNAQLKKVIARLGPGSIFGEEEIFERSKRKHTAVIASHHAELFSVSKKKFFDSLNGSYAYLRLVEQYETKKAWRKDFKKQLSESIKAIENQVKVPEKPVKVQAHLSTQLKLINTRLTIPTPNTASLKADRKDTLESLDYNFMSPEGSPTRTLETREDTLDFILMNQKEDTTASSAKPAESKANISGRLKKALKFLGSMTTGSKVNKNVTLNNKESSPHGTKEIKNRPISFKPNKSDVVSERGSPRLFFQSSLTFYDFDNEQPIRITESEKVSTSPDNKTSKRTLTVQEEIDNQKFFKEYKANKPRKPIAWSSQLAHTLETPKYSSDKMKSSIYSRVMGLSDILMVPTPKFHPQQKIFQSRSFVGVSFDAQSPEKTFDFGSIEPIKHRPTTALSMSTSVLPVRSKNQPNSIFKPLRPEDLPKKAFVNIHVQRAQESPKPQFHGGFLLAKSRQGKRRVNSDGLMAVGDKVV